jgi:hypothetical protein
MWGNGEVRVSEGNQSIRKKNPNVTFFTTNPVYHELESNPDFRGEKPATNLLSYGTAKGIYNFTSCLHGYEF